jgi:hypothetical protein
MISIPTMHGVLTRIRAIVPTIGINAQETFEEYALAQTSNFHGGMGWKRAWDVVGNFYDITVASESWERYPLGQTSSFNLGYGWTGNLFSHYVGLEARENWEIYSLGQTGSFSGDFGWIGFWRLTVSGSV